MPPDLRFYRTMTGEIECVNLDGVVFVRYWPHAEQFKPVKSEHPWRVYTLPVNDLPGDCCLASPEESRLICIIHCLCGAFPCHWASPTAYERALADEAKALASLADARKRKKAAIKADASLRKELKALLCREANAP